MQRSAPVIAFVGLGLMGQPMASNLIQAGFPLRLWNRTRAKAEALRGANAQVCDALGNAIAAADIVITMLESGPILDQLLYASGVYREARPGTLFIDMSSIAPSLAQAHAGQLAAEGCAYLDAPVSGGTLGAAAATLSIMVGGDASVFERAREPFEAMGQPHHIGPTGCGQLAKLANQAIVGITIGAVSEALLLAEAGGADPKAVRQALAGGFAGSRILELHGQRMIERDFTPGARATVQLKDMDTIVANAEQLGVELPLSRQVQALYRQMIDEGRAGLDHSALFLQLEANSRRESED